MSALPKERTDASTEAVEIASAASAPDGRGIAGRVASADWSEVAALLTGLAVVAVMVFWAAHNGGYDTDTWSWGGLLFLSFLIATVLAFARRRTLGLSRSAVGALSLFGAYVAWSYLSITWAASPGDAFQGSNRALTYFLLFALMVAIPWTPRVALGTITAYALGIGTLAAVLVFRLGLNSDVANLVIGHRLAAPTGYFNATAALFTSGALVAVGLAAQRRLPALVRGLLLAMACADLELATAVQSRGWLFTLPFVLAVSLLVSTSRLRLTITAIVPAVATLACLHRLLLLGQAQTPAALQHAAVTSGTACLLSCAAAFAAGMVLAWGDVLRGDRHLAARWHRAIGLGLAVSCLVVVIAGGSVATHGHPFRFVSRQINGFTKDPSPASSASLTSHFSEVGSGRYDFWRVSLKAFVAHPIEGLGQDNFDSYYLQHARTSEEPAWTHSLEMRLLAHTGIVGFVLFVGFLICAVVGALRRRKGMAALPAAVIGVGMLPLVDWLIHGSVDWFWEMPALSGPACAFMGLGMAISATGVVRRPAAGPASVSRAGSRPRLPRIVPYAAAIVLALAGTGALASGYLSAREVAIAAQIRDTKPAQALAHLHEAAAINPLDAGPGRLAGAIAMQIDQPATAQTYFDQSVVRAPEAWFAWLGAGLAASQLHETSTARRDFQVALRLNHDQPVIRTALARVAGHKPLNYDQMLSMLQLSA